MKKLAVLPLSVFAMVVGAALAQVQVTDNHNVRINVPVLLSLTLDSTDVHFDFTDTTTATGTVLGLDRANDTSYQEYLQNGTATKNFAPTDIDGAAADFVQAEILTNRVAWTLSVALGADVSAPFAGRLRLYAELDDVNGAKKGSVSGGFATSYASLGTTSAQVAQATSNGQGKSFYELYYAFELQPSDSLVTAVNDIIQVIYTLSAP